MATCRSINSLIERAMDIIHWIIKIVVMEIELHLAISELGLVLNRLKAFSLEAMQLTKEATSNVSLLDHFDKIMPAKKTHEVARMYTAVEEGVRKTGCSAVVDLGSGKGYLSQVMLKNIQYAFERTSFLGSFSSWQYSSIGR